jgi:hypothetical protein
MKLIASYIVLSLIPAITFASSLNDHGSLANEILRYVIVQKDDAFRSMEESKTTSIYIYHRGKYDAYCDILDGYESLVR